MLAWGVDDCSCCGAVVLASAVVVAGTSDAVVGCDGVTTGWVLAAATSFGEGLGGVGSGEAAACWTGAASTGTAEAVLVRFEDEEADFTGAMGLLSVSVEAAGIGAGVASGAGVMAAGCAAGSGAGCAEAGGIGWAGRVLDATTGLFEDEPE